MCEEEKDMHVPPNKSVCYELAIDYMRGINGKAKNEFAAFLLLENAAKRNYHKAQRTLAEFYINGYGDIYPVNVKKGEMLMELAAVGGDTIAIKYMNVHYPSNTWLQKALECDFITCDEFISYIVIGEEGSLNISISSSSQDAKLYVEKVTHYLSMISKQNEK